MSPLNFLCGDRRHLARVTLIVPMALVSTLAGAAGDGDIAKKIMNSPCKGGETVEQYLDRKLSSSYPDLGWRLFLAEDGFQAERAFLASKFTELRYRWAVDRVGQVRPISERAQNLCS